MVLGVSAVVTLCSPQGGVEFEALLQGFQALLAAHESLREEAVVNAFNSLHNLGWMQIAEWPGPGPGDGSSAPQSWLLLHCHLLRWWVFLLQQLDGRAA